MEPNTLVARIKYIDEHYKDHLRPKTINEFIGQDSIRNSISNLIRESKEHGKPLDHMFLYGPPGSGKNTMVAAIANEMGVKIKSHIGEVIKRPGDLAAILTNLDPNDILFVDQIDLHPLDFEETTENILIGAMNDFQLNIEIGEGLSSRSIKLDLPKFTLVITSSCNNLLSNAIQRNIKHFYKFDYYNDYEITKIILRTSNLLNISIDTEGARFLASISCGSPCISNYITHKMKNSDLHRSNKVFTSKIICEVLHTLAETNNDANAQYILGTMLEKGTGVSQDDKMALYWFKEAARNGINEAQYLLGLRYTSGFGVSVNEVAAFNWFEKAAEQGHADSMFQLGKCYEEGNGVRKNSNRATQWYRLSADFGNLAAKDRLGQ